MKTSRFIAKVLGLYGLALVLIVVAGGSAMKSRMLESIKDPAFVLLSKILAIMIGLAMVVKHNVWDGTWRVVITAVGYLFILKGILLLCWPEGLVALSREILQGAGMPFYMLLSAVFYGWMTWVGFRPQVGELKAAAQQEKQPASSRPKKKE